MWTLINVLAALMLWFFPSVRGFSRVVKSNRVVSPPRAEVRVCPSVPKGSLLLGASNIDDDGVGEMDNFKSSFVSILGNPNVG